MISSSEINPNRWKQQSQMLQMRGAQMAQNQTGQSNSTPRGTKTKGSKKQLIGTILGILAGIVVLVLLKLVSNF